MKRFLSILLCMMLLLSMFASLTSCANEESDDKDDKKEETSQSDEKEETGIVDTWVTTINMGDIMETQEDAAEMLAMFEGLDLSKISFDLVAEFKDDDTYTLKVDEESAEKMIEDIKVAFKDVFIDMMEEQLGEDWEASIEAEGYTVDSLIEESFAELSADEFTGEMDTEGCYLYEDGKLYTTDDTDTEADEDCEAITVEISGKTMKWTAVENTTDDEDAALDALFPLTFKRA